MGRFTEEEIQLASKYEIMFYPINREMQSKTEYFFTHHIGKSEKLCIVKFVGKFIHWINQHSHLFLKETYGYIRSQLYSICLSVATEPPDFQVTFHLLLSSSWKGLYLSAFFKPLPNSSYSFAVPAGIHSPSSAKPSLSLYLNIPFMLYVSFRKTDRWYIKIHRIINF